jgi:hypothetical protein
MVRLVGDVIFLQVDLSQTTRWTRERKANKARRIKKKKKKKKKRRSNSSSRSRSHEGEATASSPTAEGGYLMQPLASVASGYAVAAPVSQEISSAYNSSFQLPQSPRFSGYVGANTNSCMGEVLFVCVCLFVCLFVFSVWMCMRVGFCVDVYACMFLFACLCMFVCLLRLLRLCLIWLPFSF